MIDYKEIIEQLQDDSVIELMKRLGADRYVEKENEIIFPTICHNVESEEASMKLYYYKDSHIFYCYTNCEAMSIFSFLKQYYETRQIEYDWYKDIYEVILDCSNFNPNFKLRPRYERKADRYRQKEIKELPVYNDEVLDVFVKKYPVEWLNDGISKEAMDKFGILFSIPQNKIIIPHRNVKGELVGIRGRALDEWEIENIGKYTPVKIEGKWYSHPLSLNLYGLYENKENIKKNGYCIVAEGEKSVLQAESFKRDNCVVAICGSNFNKYALKILMRECRPKQIIIAFDNEELPNQFTYKHKLEKLCKKYSQYCDFSYIYDRGDLLKLKESPFDKGEEVFEKLLERSIRVE